MRFDTLVDFISEGKKRYIPEQGYSTGTELVTSRMANVTDLGTNRSVQLFGDVDTNRKVIRLMVPVGTNWSYCKIGGKKYRQVTATNVLKGHSMIVGEYHG